MAYEETTAAPTDRPLTPMETALEDLSEAQYKLNSAVGELATRLKAVLKVPYNLEKTEMVKASQPEPERSPHVRAINNLTERVRNIEDIVTHLLAHTEA